MPPRYYEYNPKGLAKYRKDKGLDDSGEKKRQSEMNSRAKSVAAAKTFVDKNFSDSDLKGNTDAYSTYEDWRESIFGNLATGYLSDYFPEKDWAPAFEPRLRKIWKEAERLKNKGTGEERPSYIPPNASAEVRQGRKK